MLTVSEESLSRALLLCLERAKQVVEPAGAAAVAALMENPGMFEPPVVAVLSGGNIDPLLLSKVLRHGLAAAGRYLTFRCRIPDRPGALAGLLGAVAGLGANVLDVMHERITPRLRVDEVEVLLQVETRGPAHCDDVISQLREAGVPADVPVSGGRRSSAGCPRRACSRSMASNSALKLPLPKPSEPCRSISSKNTVGRSCTGLVKICSR